MIHDPWLKKNSEGFPSALIAGYNISCQDLTKTIELSSTQASCNVPCGSCEYNTIRSLRKGNLAWPWSVSVVEHLASHIAHFQATEFLGVSVVNPHSHQTTTWTYDHDTQGKHRPTEYDLQSWFWAISCFESQAHASTMEQYNFGVMIPQWSSQIIRSYGSASAPLHSTDCRWTYRIT